MVRSFLMCLLVAGFVSAAYSQTTLSICASVEKDGYCAFDNDKFITQKDTGVGRLYMLVRNPVGIGYGHLTYNLYEVKDGKETFQNKVEQTLQPDWIYGWKIAFFKSPGKYNVKVVNDAGMVICSKTFELFDR